MKIHQERALISILPLLLRRLQLLELLSHLVDIFCVSRVFLDAERLQELGKGHNAVTMFFIFLSTKAFTSLAALLPANQFLVASGILPVFSGSRAEKRL